MALGAGVRSAALSTLFERCIFGEVTPCFDDSRFTRNSYGGACLSQAHTRGRCDLCEQRANLCLRNVCALVFSPSWGAILCGALPLSPPSSSMPAEEATEKDVSSAASALPGAALSVPQY